MGHLHTLLDEMGLDEMGLDEMAWHLIGSSVKCVCGQTVNSWNSAQSNSQVFLQCGQVVKQPKCQSRFLDPGRSCDYGIYGSVTLLQLIVVPNACATGPVFLDTWLHKLLRTGLVKLWPVAVPIIEVAAVNSY